MRAFWGSNRKNHVIASLENTVSLRTIPQDGVAIPR